MDSRTLQNAWEAFEASNPKDLSLYQSALFRFTLPGLGGHKPSGARLSSKEMGAGLKTLASISISPDIGDRLREAQKQTFTLLNTPKERQRQPRYYLNHLIEWGIKNDFFSSGKLAEEEKQSYRIRSGKIQRIKTTNRRGVYKKFAFSFDVADYKSEPLNPEQIQHHLQRINQEFTNFFKYQITVQGNREATAQKRDKYLKQFLGWFYQEKGVALTEIGLSKIVPFIRLNLKISEFFHEENQNPWLSQTIAKAEALENIKDEANRLVDLLTEFFAWLENPPSFSTKRFYIDAVIAYAKYVYRTETDKTMALRFDDIPLINRLKVFYKEAKNSTKEKSNPSIKLLWPEVFGVLEKLRFEANLTTRKKGNYRENRPLSARVYSLQDFVLLGFFVLVPPSRQRVIRELELGRTLKYGIFENGRFTSSEKMTNPGEAKYYIDLQAEDYKTGKTYKEWRCDFPNTEFPDGSKFYDYLNRWLFCGYQDESGEWHGMREVLASAGERTVFVTRKAGRALTKASMYQKITRIFSRWTGVPVSPHDLRHIYRSYIDDPATGATSEEQKSAAYWMRHSSEMAKKYSHLDNEKKLQAGTQMAERLNRQLLNGKK